MTSLCVCVYVYMDTCVHMCVKVEDDTEYLPHHPLSYFFSFF